MALTNVVFDFGGVTVGYDPKAYMRRLFPGEDPAGEYILRELFGSEFWRQMDLGRITRREADAIVLRKAEADGFGAEMKYVQEHWFKDMMGTREDTVSLIRELRAAGYGVWYLTNMPEDLWAAFTRRGLPQLFMGGVASWAVHVTKPDAAIYRLMLERCGLRAGECVFLDDMEPNVRGAEAVGMRGLLFTGAAQARERLCQLGVRL